MEKRNEQTPANKNTDVTRTQNQEAQQAADTTNNQKEERAEGSKYKGNPAHNHGSHKEGSYPRQSDDPTMHPGKADEA